jgi:steroid 5-alpha reductase family enzyme
MPLRRPKNYRGDVIRWWGGPTMATAEDAIDWLELHVNYTGEDLTWNDLMFIRMERAIERQIAELRERNIGGMEEL